ncbi:hypothetical protein WJX81_007463 [Elliptochloris bilobata]|uniref:C3H1-type domain-containing protein n=1 Tax=Elliptochloris bilobata TaxID=381761 RepID=A0AAW1SKC5_9CHLO
MEPSRPCLYASLPVPGPHVPVASGAVRQDYGSEFYMLRFKVERCTNPLPHDHTACPAAHHGEKARRRCPLKYRYTGVPCPDFRKGSCKRGDACPWAHGVFECWLHPSKYRTQLCNDGPMCSRPVCFFAHTASELRETDLAAAGPAVSPKSRQGGKEGFAGVDPGV